MAEKHIANKEGIWRAVNTSPDFCKVGTSVVPFDIYRDLSGAILYSRNVYARGLPVLTVTSRLKGVIGDTGSGVASQVSLGAGDVIVISGSSTVYTNRLQTAYNLSDCLMNVGAAPNCPGKILTDQSLPALRIENGKLPCNDPPRNSPELDRLLKLKERHKSTDPAQVDEIIQTGEAQKIVEEWIKHIQTKPESGWRHVAGAARGVLGVGNRIVFGLADLVKLAVKHNPLDPEAMFHDSLNAQILAEHIRLGNVCLEGVKTAAQAAKWELLKPVTEPWSAGEHAEAITAGALELAMLVGPLVDKLGGILKAAEATRAAEAARAAEVARVAEGARAVEITRTSESKVAKSGISSLDGIQVRAKKFFRSKVERRKTLLRDARDPNSGLTQEAREFILEHDGYKVPPGYEVSHERPLYTADTVDEKRALDVESNMKTMKKIDHRARHRICGNQYHEFPR